MGSTLEAFEKHQGRITGINKESLRPRHLSIEDIVGEASELVQSSQQDVPVFNKIARFEMSHIHTLPERIDAFMHCYAEYQNVALDKSDSKEQWNAIDTEAYIEKRKLIRRLELIYEEDGRDADLKLLKKIAIGRGRRDLTMDYLQLSDLAQKDAEQLLTLNYSEAEVARISEIFETLKSLIGSITEPKAGIEEKRLRMEQAYTYLDEAVSSIRKYGQLIFEDDDRESLYKSQFHVDIGKSSNKSAN